MSPSKTSNMTFTLLSESLIIFDCIRADILPLFLYAFLNAKTSFSRTSGLKTNLGLAVKNDESFSSVNFLFPSKEIKLTVGYSSTAISKFPLLFLNLTLLNRLVSISLEYAASKSSEEKVSGVFN